MRFIKLWTIQIISDEVLFVTICTLNLNLSVLVVEADIQAIETSLRILISS